MVSSINRYKWVLVLLAVIVLVTALSPWLLPQMSRDLLSGTDHGSTDITPVAVPSLDQPTTEVGIVLHLCLDTPPLFSAVMAHKAAVAIADELDTLVVPGFKGLKFYSSYIASKSYQDETGVNFTISSVPSLSPRPVQKHSPDPYQDALLKQKYQTEVDTWQAQVNLQLSQLTALRATVHGLTNRLRSLSFPFDDRGADYRSCLYEAGKHLLDAPSSAKTRLIVLASALVDNQHEQGYLNLTGVDVKSVFYSCSDSAIACLTRVATIKHLVMQAHAKSFSVLDVAESQAQQVLF